MRNAFVRQHMPIARRCQCRDPHAPLAHIPTQRSLSMLPFNHQQTRRPFTRANRSRTEPIGKNELAPTSAGKRLQDSHASPPLLHRGAARPACSIQSPQTQFPPPSEDRSSPRTNRPSSLHNPTHPPWAAFAHMAAGSEAITVLRPSQNSWPLLCPVHA